MTARRYPCAVLLICPYQLLNERLWRLSAYAPGVVMYSSKRVTDIGKLEKPIPADNDPFFRLPTDSNWNALIGRQGNELNYVDGYIEAAIELASAVIEKKMTIKRDTLVMPILYNARHALELSLKFAINESCKMGIIKEGHQKNHDIMSHWSLLDDSMLGDEELTNCVSALKPYVTSLSEIDDDGQELRYRRTETDNKVLQTVPWQILR